jgi:UDP-N-acetylmuramyl pentapeptide synthase
MERHNSVALRADNIIEIMVVGNQTIESVQEMADAVGRLAEPLEREHRPILVLDNLLNIGAVSQPARERVVQLAKHMRYDRLAMVGNNGLLRLGANLMLRATGKGDKARFFVNHGEAATWLLASF